MNIKVYLAVAVGGMIGAIGRYYISVLFSGNTGFLRNTYSQFNWLLFSELFNES
ncbi:hypothetical protein [Oceanobacillus zhaokaii]|uniref:hypothetical protein n=1 Tax=Oceanobacillus zhaokaii TaxID=2052660 RepID=UPI001FA883F3|nr:hypothetical protein [Oceanobacillus zhaokaii]